MRTSYVRRRRPWSGLIDEVVGECPVGDPLSDAVPGLARLSTVASMMSYRLRIMIPAVVLPFYRSSALPALIAGLLWVLSACGSDEKVVGRDSPGVIVSLNEATYTFSVVECEEDFISGSDATATAKLSSTSPHQNSSGSTAPVASSNRSGEGSG